MRVVVRENATLKSYIVIEVEGLDIKPLGDVVREEESVQVRGERKHFATKGAEVVLCTVRRNDLLAVTPVG